MPIYSSDSDDQPATPIKLFGNRRPLYDILGRGKVADILLWRNKSISAGILVGATMVWFLFEVVEYNFITLLCHTILALMFILFIWSNAAPLVQRDPPNIYEFQLSDDVCRYVFGKINRFLSRTFDISRGTNWKLFFGTISFLWILSVLGNYVSTLNLLYFGTIFVVTVPALYERYEREVDYMAGKGSRDVKKLYKTFDAKVLNKIPRGPVKEKRFT